MDFWKCSDHMWSLVGVYAFSLYRLLATTLLWTQHLNYLLVVHELLLDETLHTATSVMWILDLRFLGHAGIYYICRLSMSTLFGQDCNEPLRKKWITHARLPSIFSLHVCSSPLLLLSLHPPVSLTHFQFIFEPLTPLQSPPISFSIYESLTSCVT